MTKTAGPAKWFLLLSLLSFASCGGNEIGTGVGNPPTSTTTKVAAAVVSLFSQSDEAAELTQRLKFAAEDSSCVGTPVTCFCEEVISGGGNPPQGVENSGFRDAGTYGSTAREQAVTTEDFCVDPDGIANSSNGPDGAGLFGAFELTGDVIASCSGADDSAELTFLTGSYGIHRNVETVSEDTEFQTQIYGTFLISDGTEEAAFDCTIFIAENGTSDFVSCTDSDGIAVEQESGVSCEF